MNALRYILRRGKRLVLLAINGAYDLLRYFRHSAKSGTPSTDQQLPFQLMVQYHAIEKGLSLRDVRLGFGQAHLDEIFRLLREWRCRNLDCADRAFTGAVAALEGYVRFHQERGYPVEEVEKRLHDLCLERGTSTLDGATIAIQNDDVRREARSTFDHLAASRHSIRNFDGRPVAPELIERAVGIASYSPSACNRQAWRVHALRDPSRKRAALELQNGNRGFRESIDVVLVVTCDLRAFGDPTERNQAWIDGGMFAMTLLHALHFLGLGACALNWCTTWAQDRTFRQAVGIPANECILMLVAVGHLPSTLRVARSKRRDVSEILKVR
jgi:nitroreductase